MQLRNDEVQFKQTSNTARRMMKFSVFLLVLFAVVNSDGEGNVLPIGDEGGFMSYSADGDYFSMTRDMLYDPYSPKEIAPKWLATLTTSDLNVGSVSNTYWLLFSARPRLTGIAGIVRVQNVRFYRTGVRILAFSANRTVGSPSANPRVVAGGLNNNTVTVRFTSLVGQGFDYRLQVWGQERQAQKR